MWRTISAVWLTLATLLNWILRYLMQRFFHTVDKWKTVGSPESTATVDLETKVRSDDASCVAAGAAESKPLHKYDVFINHRGPDVKATFAAHLNAALQGAGFIPFLDAKCIKQGRHVFKSIDEALSGACVHVAIISKRYAESKYCLDELVEMLQSGKIILPVFYDVKPEHLRRIENGPFAEGFRKHQKRKRHEKIPKWKKALRNVSEMMGYEANGDDNELVRSIVVAVRNEMPVNLHPQKRRFGLDEALGDASKRLNIMEVDNVNVLGLVGMGGIGKTTLATVIYNHFVSRRLFQHHSFLKDVRSSVPFELQRQLVRDLIEEDLHSNSPAEYLHKFEVFSRQRVLLVVDDIDNASQFANLIPDIQQLGRGSRILLTSRHRDVLNLAMRPAACRAVYEVKLLNRVNSRQLFNWNAFYSDVPSEDFRDLAEKVADACGGHPLALEIIGASLFDKKDPDADREIWMEAIKTLKENDDILDKLRISYTGLPTKGDKAMFRDIACLLIGMPQQVAMAIWSSCRSCTGGHCSTPRAPHLVLRRLMDKSLVTLESGRLVMHDVIRDMGRDVVLKESPNPEGRTHLWDAASAAEVLSTNKRTDRVRGIRLSTKEIRNGDLTCVASQFASMAELHLLVLDGCLVVPDDFSKWSPELRWLQWRWLPHTELPAQLNLPNLTVLDLSDSGTLTHLWLNDAPIQFPLLQMLILTNCKALEELPENIGQSLPRLKTMEMGWCSRIAGLPNSVGQLKELEQLILSDCKNLKMMPDTIVGMAKLKKLVLDGCSELKQLPMELRRLYTLEVLNLSDCENLNTLPSSMGGLGMLKELHMKSTPVQDVPEDFGQLVCLTSLSMLNDRSVPETSSGELEKIAGLHLGEVSHLGGRLTSSLGALTALKTLHLGGNRTITALPKSFGNLKTLVHFQMVNCPALLTVEVLPERLQHLDLANCPQLFDFPSLAGMRSLTFLMVCNCRSLTQIHGLECLTALEDINLSGIAPSDCMSVVQSGLHRSMRMCCLSGSKVAVAYDNRWLEKEPAQQLISYYDDAIGFLPNGMARKVVDKEWAFEVLAEATITSKAECVALIFCFVAHDQGWSIYPLGHGQYASCCGLEVHVMRDGKLVTETGLLSLRHADSSNQVYLWTLRREHPVVQSLQLGDMVCVYARSKWPGWKITVLEGAICVVHAEDDHQLLAINSHLLNGSHSEALATKLGQLVLADNFHSSLKSELKIDEIDTELVSTFHSDLLASAKGSLSEHAANPDLTSSILPEQGWCIPPAYGHYHWTHSWRLPREGQGNISFEAQGSSVHVAISTCCNESWICMYEVIIRNTNSVLQRYDGKGHNLLVREGPQCFSVAAGLLHPEGSNRLWVAIDERTSTIQVGRGEPYQDVIAIYRDSAFLSSVQFVSFTSFRTAVTCSGVVITDVEHTNYSSLLRTCRLSEKIDDPSPGLNEKWALAKLYGTYTWAHHWMLPSAGRGIFSFVAEGSRREIYVAISTSPRTTEPLYEIVIGGYYGTSTVLRKQPQGPLMCDVKTEHLITSPSNQFWVLLDDRTGTIQVGRGEPCQDMFWIYKDPEFLSEAKYCTFTTWDYPVTFSSMATMAISN